MKKEIVYQVELLRCERDENFIYITLPLQHRSARHRNLRVKLVLMGHLKKTLADQLKQLEFVIEEHDAPGAPARTHEELTVTVHEVHAWLEREAKRRDE